MARQTRAEATRTRLIEATIAALAECGYSGTSTQEVCRRAGVSRGTMLHHFPTRLTLLVASLDDILSDRVERFVDTHGGGPTHPAALVRALWDQWQGPVYVAWLELAVAARTEPELRKPMREVMERFDAQISDAFAKLVDLDSLPPDLAEVVPTMVFALFNGLMVGASYEAEDRAGQGVVWLERAADLWATGGVR